MKRYAGFAVFSSIVVAAFFVAAQSVSGPLQAKLDVGDVGYRVDEQRVSMIDETDEFNGYMVDEQRVTMIDETDEFSGYMLDEQRVS